MIICGFEKEGALAKSIAKKINASFSQIGVSKFPDGEVKITIPSSVRGKVVVLVRSLLPANDALIEVIFSAQELRNRGVKKITLVSPYLGYMRQDVAFHRGEVISAQGMARLLSKHVDRIVTIDPHLHRIKALSKVFSISTKTISSVGVISDYIKKKINNVVIVGPDSESSQWDKKVAQLVHAPFIVLNKERKSSYKVKIKFDDRFPVKGRNVVIIDDIISTGRTLLKTINHLKQFKPRGIYCFGVHGLFVGDASSRLVKSGAKIICTNTVPNKFDKIDISGIVSEILKK